MSDRRFVSRLLPAPLRHYWPAAMSKPPPGLADWEFWHIPADHMEPGRLRAFGALWQPRSDDLDPPPSSILLGNPRSLDRVRSQIDIPWLRASFPWLSLVVVIPEPLLDPLASASVSTAMAQAGAVVVTGVGVSHMGDRSRPEIETLVHAAFVPELALPIWFRTVLPAWPSKKRNAVVSQLVEGMSVAAAQGQEHRAGPSRRRLWFLVGRALYAALVIQAGSDGKPLDQLASAAGYHDHHSMDRSLRRWFGLRARDIRGTTGWEWLLWRFLNGLGTGPRRFWDR